MESRWIRYFVNSSVRVVSCTKYPENLIHIGSINIILYYYNFWYAGSALISPDYIGNQLGNIWGGGFSRDDNYM